jgi:predicted outer membrane repeat protein
MDRPIRGPRSRLLPILLVASLVAALLAAESMTYAAAGGTCLVTNSNTGQTYPPSDGATLQQAIHEATHGDVLIIRGRCVGGFSIGKALTLQGQPTAGYPLAMLDGDRADLVLQVNYTSISLEHLLITRGLGNSGAGISNNGGTITLMSTSVTDNRGGGGAIFNAGTLALRQHSHVSDNRSLGSGGGIYNYYGEVVLRGSSYVSRNRAANVGGAIYSNGTIVLLGSSRVTHNTSGNSGGGIYNGGNLELNGLARVSGNFAGLYKGGTANGGGVFNEGGTLTLNAQSKINGNHAKAGGGVCNSGFGRTEMLIMNDQSQIRGNTARNGGGVCNYDATTTMHGSSRVWGNTASRDGGGIWDREGAITMTASSSIAQNVAEGGTPSAPTGRGGGIRTCATTLTGVTEGVNVVDNVPNNIEECP